MLPLKSFSHYNSTMKITKYYSLLLILLCLITGFLLQSDAETMSMPQMLSVSVFLGIYVVTLSLIGEGKTTDERDLLHRYASNRIAYIAGVVTLSIGILVQLFNHTLDYWLLGTLIVMNSIKIISRIYCYYKK